MYNIKKSDRKYQTHQTTERYHYKDPKRDLGIEGKSTRISRIQRKLRRWQIQYNANLRAGIKKLRTWSKLLLRGEDENGKLREQE